MRAPKLVVVLAVVALVALSCGSSDEEAEPGGDPGVTTTVDDHDDDADDHDDGFAFGEPVPASEADRVVDIDMNDEMRFVPDEVTVAEGETITFRLHNRGRIAHDFTIGDAETQAAHDDEMRSTAAMVPGRAGSHAMGPRSAMPPAGMVADPAGADHGGNAITVAPGNTAELTWHFTQVADILFGCHIPGHYDAGMRGSFVTG